MFHHDVSEDSSPSQGEHAVQSKRFDRINALSALITVLVPPLLLMVHLN